MNSRTIVILIVAVVVAAVVSGLCVYLWMKNPQFRAMIPLPGRCEDVQLPELRPSGGLTWSKGHYPDEYGETNLNVVAFVGLNDRSNERFLDAGGRAFSREFVSSFSYTEPERAPKVRLEYLKKAETFAGRIVARGLKPNFAYQMKLHGIFADRQAFERIGHLGRWRMPGYATNYSDKDYDAYPNKAEVESYLAFDFFVTDGQGNVDKEFYADSTLHVLFNSTWQRRPAPEDGRPIMAMLTVPNGLLYSNPAAGLVVQGVYAQSEQHALGQFNRPAIGEAFLPAGRYTADVVLTEESFHTYGDGGWWGTVMKAPVEFEVIDMPRPCPRWTGGEQVMSLSLADAVTTDIDVTTRDASELRGVATSQKPAIDFAQDLNLDAGERYFVRADVVCAHTHGWEVWVDTGAGLEDERGDCYPARSSKCLGWREFDVEITGAVAGRQARLRIRPALGPVEVGVRNVSIYRIPKEPPPGPASSAPK